MDQLTQYIAQNQNSIVKCGNAIIIVVALVFIGVNVIKAIAAFSRGSVADGFKNVFYIAMIGLLAWVSIKGFMALIKKVAPDDNILPKGNDQFGSVASLVTSDNTSSEVVTDMQNTIASVAQY